jgi:hypothetical protein
MWAFRINTAPRISLISRSGDWARLGRRDEFWALMGASLHMRAYRRNSYTKSGLRRPRPVTLRKPFEPSRRPGHVRPVVASTFGAHSSRLCPTVIPHVMPPLPCTTVGAWSGRSRPVVQAGLLWRRDEPPFPPWPCPSKCDHHGSGAARSTEKGVCRIADVGMASHTMC